MTRAETNTVRIAGEEEEVEDDVNLPLGQRWFTQGELKYKSRKSVLFIFCIKCTLMKILPYSMAICPSYRNFSPYPIAIWQLLFFKLVCVCGCDKKRFVEIQKTRDDA